MSTKVTSLNKEQILGLLDRLCSQRYQPLHFIRGINSRAIHSELLDSLALKSSTAKNLCFRIEEGACCLTILAEYLAWDSEHFGFGVGKISYLDSGDLPDSDFTTRALETFIVEAKKVGVKYLTSSLDVRMMSAIHALSTCRFTPIEFRAHYYSDLKGFAYPKRFKVRLANEKDVDSLSETAANTQNPYDRFFGDPTLNPSAVKDLMRLWVKNSVTTSFANGVIVPDMENPKAFCTFKTHQHNWSDWGVKLGQPILAAVSPELSGWYVKVMSELSYYLRELGAERAFMTTQLGNLAVIRTWEALNYSYGGSEVVLRWTENNRLFS